MFLGQGPNPLEVAIASASSKPNASDVRQLWKRRKGARPAPLLLVVLYSADGGFRAATCGPIGEEPTVATDRDVSQVERIAATALAEPNRNAAVRFLTDALSEADSELPGIRNMGMFATHELVHGVPNRKDWKTMSVWGRKVLTERGHQLVSALGFQIEQLGAATSVLRLAQSGQRAAVAVFLDETETPEGASSRFGSTSPVSHALAQADAERLPYVVLTRGPQIRLYSAGKDVGVGRKGRAETFIEANLALIPDDLAGYLPLLFGVEALRPDGSFEEILDRSKDFSTGLGERLRDRVYNEVVPRLADIVIDRREIETPTEVDLAALYEMAMVILFRLLFIAYAEDKDLLPYRSNGLYQRNALKSLARDLADLANDGRFDPDPAATNWWDQVSSLWRAVDRGNRDWGVPPYNGGMFSSDPAVSEVGKWIENMKVSNAEFGPALLSLLVDQTTDGTYGPVDFRSLTVREFGTIYEGLLESNLAVASTDLTTDSDGTYLPAKQGDEVVVPAGKPYLHDRSGARKATGSYFTKPFAVKHLLEHALEPILDDHLARILRLIEEDKESETANAFFDIRVADIAMGSGHFLVAAVDHIEARLSSFLAEHPIPSVVNELQRLAKVARDNLGDLVETVEIEQASLLRRQVARRCIYGVDLNLIAVELARLGIWIHTFVPGLPLSFLDHNLVEGNSLTGIGTLDEAVDALIPTKAGAGTKRALRSDIQLLLKSAEPSLRKLARTADASAQEIADARAAHLAAREAVETVRKLFDLACAVRVGEVEPIAKFTEEHIVTNKRLPDAERLARELQALHFPIAFPEVFLRDNPGFDCILGNPPWEKVMAESGTFWAIRFPGLRAKGVAEQNRMVEESKRMRPDLAKEFDDERARSDALRGVLLAGPYPGLGKGHPDLYKAFAWRFWHLIRGGGRIGVVLPRSAFVSAGGATWRETLLMDGSFEDVSFLINTRNWAFDDMEPRYTIALQTYRKGGLDGVVRIRGPYHDLEAYEVGVAARSAEFLATELQSWTSGAVFPLIPDGDSGEVFRKLRGHPHLDADVGEWRVRPVQGDLNSTVDKPHMLLDPETTDGLWPVYAGSGFRLWNPDTKDYYAWADPDHITGYLQERRKTQQQNRKSAFSEFKSTWAADPITLPVLHPRIAFRRISRATDSRTVICALVPPRTPLVDTAPYLAWPRGTIRDQAYLLGVLSSIPLDWCARKVVETHVDHHVINAFPIPRPDRRDPWRERVEAAAGRLAAVDPRFSDWAEVVGVPVASVSDVDRDRLLSEVDAAVAHLYGLNEADLTHIFQTFHVGWNFGSRLEATLVAFREMS